MYEFLPPLLRYSLLAALYVFLFIVYAGLQRSFRRAVAREPAPAMPSRGPARLIVATTGGTSSALVGEEIPLLTRNVIGRDESCNIVLDDDFASKHHAAIELEGDGYTLTDLGSRNGTFLNGTPVGGPSSLADGDELQIGSTVLRFQE